MLSRLSIVALLALASLPAGAATTLKGVLLVNELSGSPMENVGVDAISGTNLTSSDLSGKFTLEFPKRRAGDTVRIIVKKEGYVVVNDVQLATVLPADADAAPLTIILAKEPDREEMARRFYRLKSFEVIEKSYQQRVKELEDTQQATAATMTKLQQERDQAKAEAGKAAEQLAKNQLGQSSELNQQAKRLFLDGKIEEAIKLLDDEKLRQSVAQAKETIEQQKKAIDDAVQAWLLKAHMLTFQLRFDDAEKAYLQAIDAEPDKFEANFAYGVFNQELNRYEKAEMAYGRCLEWARKNRKDAERAGTLNNLGILDCYQNRMDEARKEYEEALETYRELAQKKPDVYLHNVTNMLINLGNLDSNQNRMDEARKEYEEALMIGRKLAQKNSDVYLPDLAITLNDLGMLASGQNRIDEARKEFEEAVKIFRELAQKNPETYRPYVAGSVNSLGNFDRNRGQMEDARTEYVEALQIRRELAQKNPETYQPYVAETLNNLGNLDNDQRRMEEARKEYAEALQTYRELTQKDPDTYRPYVAVTLNNLGTLDRNRGRMEDARTEYAEALQILSELAQKNPETYRPYLAATLNNLGILDSDQGRNEAARTEYAETLQIYRELAQKNPEIYRPYVAQTLNNLGNLDNVQRRNETARTEYAEALQIYETFANQNPERFSADVKRVKKLLAELPSAERR